MDVMAVVGAHDFSRAATVCGADPVLGSAAVPQHPRAADQNHSPALPCF